MTITTYHSIESAKSAKGLTVVIDVFRAFSTACYIIRNGAKTLIAVGEVDTAHWFKKEHENTILVGERMGKKLSGFDFGNSPSELEHEDFHGKTVVLTTNAGTRGLVDATHADEIITGSFVNARAVVSYINQRNPKEVSLVCTGTANEHILDEDALCARYMENALSGKPNDFGKIVHHLKKEGHADHFFDPAVESHPERDFDLCMALDAFDFVLKAESYKDTLLQLRKHNVTRSNSV